MVDADFGRQDRSTTITTLEEALDEWRPESLQVEDVLNPWPTAAFSAALDLPEPAGTAGDPLPPLWHWFHFLDAPSGRELGEDGHPKNGRFMPPLPNRRRMIAGGRLTVHSPMRIGDRITCCSSLVSVTHKQGRSGAMVFVTTQREFLRGDELLLVEEQDVVYRSQAPGETRTLTPRPVADQPPGRWRIVTPTSPALLFRISALTYNTHRIHYDVPYATRVEGYDGIVVHGPLLALLLLEIPRRYIERAVTDFSYRLLSPAFAGATILTHGSLDERGSDEVTVSSMSAGGVSLASGLVRLARS